jgi:hypothetical protein
MKDAYAPAQKMIARDVSIAVSRIALHSIE